MSTANGQPGIQLHDIVTAMHGHLDQLLELLHQENERLVTRQVEGLDRLLADKLQQLQALEQCGQALQAQLRAAGCDGTPQAAGDYIARLGDQTLQTQWQQLRERLQQLQVLNQSNGLVIQRGLDQLQRQLAILRGEAVAATSVYDPRGQTRLDAGKREITRA